LLINVQDIQCFITIQDVNLVENIGNRCSIRNFSFFGIAHNKRAQRALGRSPEEKVKGHSVANNREPQGHNLNNFGRGPFDDVIY